jgi:hypothetical protein
MRIFCGAEGRGPAARVHWLEGGHEFPLVERAVPLVLADVAEFFHQRATHEIPAKL